ncbi:MAG: DUF2723 domain-containing protein [Bacteroidaceae bacterium]|nr:DUF2723 domain-containing protein [Bacteroidaceae bacterium]
MRHYKITNNIMGWVIFALATFTYCSTIEPTASFWDCPEFITSATRLEVGHQPGAPFFMLVGNAFSQLASDKADMARMVNTMSALLSAGCILLLFWSITYMTRLLMCGRNGTPSTRETIAIMAAGTCGALIYTWSDTFWFSAVEAEVYAFSSFCTALVFWLILKWDECEDRMHGNRYIIFIAYIMGLSIGVHLLNLLCIPAIVLVYYYRRTSKATVKGMMTALAGSFMLIAAILFGLIPWVVRMAGYCELLCVNTLGMPFNTGTYIYLVVLTAMLVYGLYKTSNMNGERVMRYFTPRQVHTAMLSLTFMLTGYSSYAVIVIRSMAKPPMCQNDAEDMFSLREYLSREQYGDKPLLWGETYASKPNIITGKDGEPQYETRQTTAAYRKKHADKDEYVKVNDMIEYVYSAEQSMLVPRLFSSRHKDKYEQWLGDIHGKTVNYDIPGMGTRQVVLPTQIDNMRFFFSYQLNFMYWRYFMWNFAGRQNDKQGYGEWEHGNWLTGFPLIDNLRLGNQDLLPSELKNNKGHNVFYCMPLILGIIGMAWQIRNRNKGGREQFWVVMMLFFMTGIAIVLYLNQTPVEPRERDYAYAGSFYAFAIWCGLGIAGIYTWVSSRLDSKTGRRMSAVAASVLTVVPAIAVPLQMVSQTWDDHDRSKSYVCRDFGHNYLATVPHDGIIFSNGDNDTFPLWYMEDVEGERTDVRVCNLEYLQTDWYIDQMKRPAYEGKGQSTPLPISWQQEHYYEGKNEITDVNPTVNFGNGTMTMKQFVTRIYEEDPETAKKIWGENPFEVHNAISKFVFKEGIPEEYHKFTDQLPACIPTDTLYIKVDKEAVARSGMYVPEGMEIPDTMEISLEGQSIIRKSFMAMLDIIAECNFRRPIYVTTTMGSSTYGNLYRHFVWEGMAWRITPFTFNDSQYKDTVIDSKRMYDNLMNKYRYGNIRHKGIHIDETTERMCINVRRQFSALAVSLLKEGRKDDALRVLKRCDKEIPSYNVPHSMVSGSFNMALAYLECGEREAATRILCQLEQRSREYIRWYEALPSFMFQQKADDYEYEQRVLAMIQNYINKQ